MLIRRPTNVWLIAQGLTAQLAYGSLIWVPLLYQEKVIAEGYSIATATRVGGLLGAIFQVGALFSVLTGYLGDRVQAKRRLDGRALISAIGVVGAIPFFLGFLFIPLRGLEVTDGRRDVHPHPRGARPGAHQPVGGRRLPARHARPGPHLGELAQLVRPDRRRQPARAPGHRLRFGQPGERGGAVGRQRPHRRRRRPWNGPFPRRSTGRSASPSSRSSSSPPATATGGPPRHRRPTSPRSAPCSRRGATGGPGEPCRPT